MGYKYKINDLCFDCGISRMRVKGLCLNCYQNKHREDNREKYNEYQRKKKKKYAEYYRKYQREYQRMRRAKIALQNKKA